MEFPINSRAMNVDGDGGTVIATDGPWRTIRLDNGKTVAEHSDDLGDEAWDVIPGATRRHRPTGEPVNPTLTIARKLTDRRIRAAVESTLATPAATYWKSKLNEWAEMGHPITDDEWDQAERLVAEGTELAHELRLDSVAFLTTACALGSQQAMAATVAEHATAGRDD